MDGKPLVKSKGCLHDSEAGTHGCDSPHDDDDDEDLKTKMVIGDNQFRYHYI